MRTVKHAEASAASQYMRGQGLARFLVALAAGTRDALRVLVTGRISEEDLRFPAPPPGDDAAALAAAAVAAPPPEWHRQGQEEPEAEAEPQMAQQQGRKAPGGAAGELSRPLLANSIGEPPLLSPRAPPTPSRAAVTAVAGPVPAGLGAPAQVTTTVRRLGL